MKVYVASKFENRERVRVVMAALRAAGHVVVGDWTNHTVEGLTGADKIGKLIDFAHVDLAAVRDADALVLLPVPADRTRSGAHLVEFGYALGRGKLIIVIGGRPGAPTEHPIFFFLPEVHHFDSIPDALAFMDWAEE